MLQLLGKYINNLAEQSLAPPALLLSRRTSTLFSFLPFFMCPGRMDQGGEPQMFRLDKVSFSLASD